MTTIGFISLVFALSAPPAESELKAKAEALVAQLGDPDYRDREKAARQLLEIGFAAKDAVLAGQQSSDSEISDRCKKLYPAIWRHDLDKRVERFLDDPDGAIPEDLPGAARWLKVTGDTRKSREMYGEMVQAHPEILLEVELNPSRLRDVYIDFIRAVYTRTGRVPAGKSVSERPGLSAADLSLFLFLGAVGEVRPATVLPGTSSTYYYHFINSTMLGVELANEPTRKLYARWLEKERYSVVLRRGIDIAAQHGVKECAPIALKLAADLGVAPIIRATALLGFARLGTKDNIKDLEPFFKDKLQIVAVVVNGERWPVQMRDVALGAAVHLAGQDAIDFGFERRPPSTTIAVTTSYSYYAFATDEKREAAHAKWKEWAAKNLKR